MNDTPGYVAEPTPGTCPVCLYRMPYVPQVCDADRRRLWDFLRELADLVQLVPYALVPGRSDAGPRVSGSREAPLPLRHAALNLIGPAAAGTVHDTLVPLVEARSVDVLVRRVDRAVVTHKEHNEVGEEIERREVVPINVECVEQRRERVPMHAGYGELVMVPAGDQSGPLPVEAVLAEWVEDWIALRCAGEVGPHPATAGGLAMWLRDRLEWACDSHPDIAAFAQEVTLSLYAVRAVLDLSSKPIRYQAPCPGCGMLSLQRPAGRADYIECRNCGRLLTDKEYAERGDTPMRAF